MSAVLVDFQGKGLLVQIRVVRGAEFGHPQRQLRGDPASSDSFGHAISALLTDLQAKELPNQTLVVPGPPRWGCPAAT